MKFKIIESAKEVWFDITNQFEIEIDGESFSFRYNENNNSTELFLWRDERGGWLSYNDLTEDEKSLCEKIESYILNQGVTSLDTIGEEIEFDLDDN
jgi:hypothetical protein